MSLGSDPFPFKNIYPLFSCHSSFACSFVPFLDLFNQIVSEIVFAGVQSPSVGCVYLRSSFLNPVSVTGQTLDSLTTLEIKVLAFLGGVNYF